ncbi:helix-turn-helix domain-containing protein [Streptomyces tibetensis]|uniref:helix-turn-helix domain-containing protein n=2 Tax=Streptomyces tibetensis TaxID=2382123 RepID=UPI0033DA42F5
MSDQKHRMEVSAAGAVFVYTATRGVPAGRSRCSVSGLPVGACRRGCTTTTWHRSATARNAMLRETLQIFLACHRSHAATAESMRLHRNSILYRIRPATELLPAGEPVLAVRVPALPPTVYDVGPVPGGDSVHHCALGAAEHRERPAPGGLT